MISLYSGRIEDGDLRKRLIAWFHRASVRFSGLYQHLSRQLIHVRHALRDASRAITSGAFTQQHTSVSRVSALEHLSIGVLFLDRNLHTTFSNPRLKALLGNKAEAFAVQLIGERIARCLQEGQSLVFPFSCRQRLSDTPGSPSSVYVSACEIINNPDEISGYMFIVQDIRPQQQEENAPLPTPQRTALDLLASEIMHEIRNPLGSIALYASLIQERPTGDTPRWADEILRASRRLQTTIAQLLSFATEPHLTGAWIPVTQLVHEVMEATFPMWHSGRWTLVTEIQEAIPFVWGDRTLLTQALLNLLMNATEAMPQGGTVTLRAYQPRASSLKHHGQQVIAIQIEDEGSGVAPSDREKIFTPFFTTKRSGTGIGLALAQKIIYAHRGTIELSDAPMRGSCFTVLLPVETTNDSDDVLTESAWHVAPRETRESI